MLKNLKIGIKLNILLLLIFLVVIITSGSILSFILNKNAQRIVSDQALLLIETMSSVRDYTSTKIYPELADRLETDEQFVRPTIPAYSAREIFENLRSRSQYNDFFYKEATLNPTNPRDKADRFETEIVERFREQPELQQLTGFRRDIASGDLFYIARPLAVTKDTCLRCHSTPDLAPPSQIATYGNENGFGWQMNEIVGSQIISVPADRVFQAAWRLKIIAISITGVFLLLAIILINIFLKLTITDPLTKMASLSKKISTGDMSINFEQKGKDEIGILATSLNRLKVSLQMAMEMLEEKE